LNSITLNSASSPLFKELPSSLMVCFFGTKALNSSFKKIEPPLSEIDSNENL
tara:strand:+ start:908 stop:1063 length:156 start_codon:yes stop_codon:yes gene_type:complete